MSEKTKDKASKVEKRSKKEKKEKKSKSKDTKQEKAAEAAFSLLADDKTVDPTLSSLFAAQPTPLQRPELPQEPESQDGPDAELSEIEEEIDEDDSDDEDAAPEVDSPARQAQEELQASIPEEPSKRKRKRKDADDDLEAAYLRKLEKEEAKEAKEAAAERVAKRQKAAVSEKKAADEDSGSEDDGGVKVDIEPESGDEDEDEDEDGKSDAVSPPPKHETQDSSTHEATKANRTVFLGNVSTTAITSNSARKTLINHLTSFFPKDSASTPKDASKPKLESIRFRSTPYSTTVPKKAAYAKKELMDATTKSTNAYAIYSTPSLARTAARTLNATLVLDRHLRVDEVAHPAKTDHKRCVFVGNLGFVDDESNIQAANAAQGIEHRKPAKQPADAEEGLWRTMSRHGAVESVRVIRDAATRVSKGIAYVQFADENSVESALLDDEKKFPPLLPRKLRVQRAKAMKRNAKPGSGRPGTGQPATGKTGASGYKRKISAEEASQMGRAGKLYGKAAAAATVKSGRFAPEVGSANANRQPLGSRGGVGQGVLKPEAFVFEGHRASRKQGTTGLKLGGKGKGGSAGGGGKKRGKPTTRSAKRGAAYKASGKKGAA